MLNHIPNHLAIFPMRFVEDVTNLSGRQIRYYEEQNLITPVRNKGNQRTFSLNDIERLTEIKYLIDKKVNIAGIKAIIASKEQKENVFIKDEVVHSFTYEELMELLYQQDKLE
ncbi:MerR family transcriptional regulator [Evansella sp. AB-P1]|uniref:MerR family transcriptional regulator n=1 Tax=Evansella sp. AB-P1 TaxID=3037653 RepID=UPI00241C204D|nr:MerR family transcriptional regulator [Evansella sp. AB-P1]MDG5789565.1 MerR family transcriptional regulator [Evansella sp. AB-P1]